MRSVFGVELPDFERVYDRRSELDRFAPCFGDTGELRPDLALSGEQPRGRQEDVLRGAAMIIEVQKKVEPIKRWRLWVYWTLLAERLKLSTAVLCVPMSDSVARWARSLGALEIPAREALLVLDRQNMPRVTELEAARRRPSMAVLSALIHGPAGDIEVVRVAFAVSLELEDDRRWRYASAILSVVPEAARALGRAGQASREFGRRVVSAGPQGASPRDSAVAPTVAATIFAAKSWSRSSMASSPLWQW
jgi:hypothetical protein